MSDTSKLATKALCGHALSANSWIKVNESTCDIPVLSRDTFAGFDNVKVFEISSVAILEYDSDAFQGLKSVELVRLNDITFAEDKLTYRMLCDALNSVTAVQFSNLRGIAAFEWLNAPCIDDAYDNRPKIGVMAMVDCGVISITSDSFSFLNPTSVLFMNLSRNQIDVMIPGAFDRMINLRDLDLSYNRIHILAARIFKSLEAVRYLHLNGNQFRTVHTTDFTDLRLLRILISR